DRFSLALGGSLSDEDDYKSKSPFLEGKWWTVDQNTVMTAAFSPNFDRITSTNNSELLERRRTWNYLLGITQVINRRSLMQTNLTYTNGDGYQSDQYKVLDNRPQSRDAWAWLARYNLYFPSLDAAMHTNYRFFTDSWNLNSHTVEVAWYQPILESWLVRPNVRYYSQGSSEFFSNEFPPVEDNIFYTTDQRMADFGGLSLGIKVEKQLPHGFAIDFRYERFEQKRGWSMRNSEANGIAPFYGQFFGIGVSKRF
ncbi:MAG: hypothetical protein DCC75_04235, partial [Proteobacteria bacterium]